MAALSVATLDRLATVNVDNLLVAASAGGDTFVNDGKTYFVAKNASGGSINVTFVISKLVDGVANTTNKVVAVPAGKSVHSGVFSLDAYGLIVSVTYSAVTSLTVLAVKTGL